MTEILTNSSVLGPDGSVVPLDDLLGDEVVPFDDPPFVEPKHLRSSWRVAAYNRLIELADTTNEPPRRADRIPLTNARGDLQVAANAFRIGGVSSWYRGTAEEQVQTNLDRAELALVPAADAELEGYVKELKLKVERRFTAKDRRRAAALDLLQSPRTQAKARTALKVLHRGTADLRNTGRARRNQTLVAACLLTVATLLVARAIEAGFGGAALSIPSTTPGGTPTEVNPWLVALFGGIGGAITIIPMLRRTEGVVRASTAFGLQAMLKVVTGSLFGLLGVWLILSGLFDMVAVVNNPTLIMWALLFGYSQDAFTKRFDSLLATTTPPTEPTTADED